MNKIYYTLLLIFISGPAFGQIEKISVKNHKFIIKTKIIKNEWETFDTIKIVYSMNKKTMALLKYFAYKDEGGDCNNLFWNKGSIETKNDSLILNTYYFQKIGIDPIPEWRKLIYKIDATGKVRLIYDKYRYYNSTEWVAE